MLKNVLWRIAATGLLAVLAACGGTPSGSIKLTVSAPSGVNPDITVSGGPDSISKSVIATGVSVVDGLKAGTYTVTSKKVVVSGIGYNSNPATTTLTVADAQVTAAVDYAAVSGRAAITVTGIPTGGTAAIKLKKNGTQVGSTISANGTQNIDDLDPTSTTSPVVAYSLEAPNITVGSTTYSSSANGSVVPITKGASAPVAVAYTSSPGAANITVAGLGGTTTGPVNLTLTPQPSGTPITKTITADGTVNFPNLVPGSYALSAAGATVGTQDFGPTYSAPTITVASGASAATATVTYVKPSITVTTTGVTGTGNVRVTVQKGTDPVKTADGTAAAPVKVEVPTFGSYSVSVAAIQAGTNVDSALAGVAAANATVSAATPAATSSVAVTARGGTGKLYVAGNGLFNPAALNGAYSLADASIATGAVLPSFGAATASEGVLRISFDAAGNAYVIKQDAANARIIKISEANLKTNTLTEAANLTITKGAFSTVGGESEPADLAFDATGNLWIANDNGNTVACVSATRLAATTGTIGSPADKLLTAPAGTFTVSGFATSTITGANLYKNIHTLAFDTAGNLWFVSGGFVGPAATPARFAVLARVPAASLTCSGGAVATTPDLMLNISNVITGGGAGGPTIKPVAMALAPNGTSFYIADFGGSSDYFKCVPQVGAPAAACPAGFVQVKSDTQGGPTLDANSDPETIIKVNISGLTPSATNVQTATIADRIKYSAVGGTNRGMQQAFGLAFDKGGNLWVATNNNVEVNNAVGAGNVTGACDDPNLKKAGDAVGTTYTCLPTTALTDRLGKLYRFKASDVNGIPSVPAEFGRELTPDITISAPTAGTGLVGIAFNTPPANTPMNVRPTQ